MVVRMASTEEHERKVCTEFNHLLEQSKSMFNGLRDLPQCGAHIWQVFFKRTFDVYTKLWKYQQQQRPILERKLGLKRWQIGEIASKIGQLYYHYYIRTSDTIHLYEAYSFYSAIRTRRYYSQTSREVGAELTVKKLRYYARFIVVCLLMRKMNDVNDLMRELDAYVVDYMATYETHDPMEWPIVIQEIKSFVAADDIVTIQNMTQSIPFVLSHRLSRSMIPPVERASIMSLTLHEIILVGNVADQLRYPALSKQAKAMKKICFIVLVFPKNSVVLSNTICFLKKNKFKVKYSEMTIDMYRMLQTLEREVRYEECNQIAESTSKDSFDKPCPRSSYSTSMSPPIPYNNEKGKRDNPHKYLLYKPCITQIMMFLATGFKELPPNGVLLLYVSADGCFPQTKRTEDLGYDLGGIATRSKKEMFSRGVIHIREIHCLYPGDLHPYTRKPFFLIVDSNNSFSFQHVHRYFGTPFVILMSPQDFPHTVHDCYRQGNVFTLFLNSPLLGICVICNLDVIHSHHYERGQSFVNRFLAEASALFTRNEDVDPAYLQFFGDDFLRLIILRYIFCYVVLRNHEMFKSINFRPKCHPPLPENDLLDHPTLQHLIYDLSVLLNVRDQFINHSNSDLHPPN